MDLYRGVDNSVFTPWISPTPLLMIVALNDVGKREYAQGIERRRGFGEAIAARRRLVEDEGKRDIKFENCPERREGSFDVCRTWARGD